MSKTSYIYGRVSVVSTDKAIVYKNHGIIFVVMYQFKDSASLNAVNICNYSARIHTTGIVTSKHCREMIHWIMCAR